MNNEFGDDDTFESMVWAESDEGREYAERRDVEQMYDELRHGG